MLDFAHPETLPTRRAEAWRYSDLRAAVRKALPPSEARLVLEAPAPFGSDLGGGLINVINGEGPTDLGSLSGVSRLRFLSAASGTAHHAVVAFRVAAGEAAVLLESYQGRGEGYAAETELSIVLEAGARLERIVVLDEPASAVSVSRADVRLGAGAAFSQTVLASGAKLQRMETHVAHPGEGVNVRLDGVYVLDGARHADLTSVVTHAGRDGVTGELTKGVVRDTARGVFQGRIVVQPGADGTDARMGHHALLLSDRAEVDSKPELEIYADDVACAHGNTVGALDEEAMFYALSRGIPEDDARAMLIEAFLGEVIDRIEHEGARHAARAWVSEQLRRAA